MKPRIQYYEVRVKTNGSSQHSHYEAEYIDATGKILYYGEHQKDLLLAFSHLQQKLEAEGFDLKTLPKPQKERTRYKG